MATVPSPDATPSQAAPARASSAGVYDDAIVKLFFTATVTWALVGMLVGVFIALELAWWPANAGIAQLTFGRLRPLHTNAVIFAFVRQHLLHRHLLLDAAAAEDAHVQRYAVAAALLGLAAHHRVAPR